MNSIFAKNASKNVHGWERAASIAGGLVFLAKGLGRGGLGGMLQLAIGGMALARGVTGHCEAKRVLCEASQHSSTSSTPMGGSSFTGATGTTTGSTATTSPAASSSASSGSERDAQLKANAQAATGSATVTGNDSLNNPPAGV